MLVSFYKFNDEEYKRHIILYEQSNIKRGDREIANARFYNGMHNMVYIHSPQTLIKMRIPIF